jgi:fatty acid desaturase
LFQHSLWVPLVLAELLLAHLMHFHVIAFHEATHETLVPNKILNEVLGEFIGIHALMGLALFRIVHGTHHTYLATDRDEELWPFADSSKPLWFRRLIAAIELSCGLIYTPVNFLRGFLRSSSSVSRNRTRVYAELTFIATTWAFTLYFVGHFGVWGYFLILHLIPAWIAANMQTSSGNFDFVKTVNTRRTVFVADFLTSSW